MTSESLSVQSTTEWSRARRKPRSGLRLTAKERKRLLLATDLLLANLSLLGAVFFWNEFTPSVSSIVAHGKWFITFSVLWLAVGTVLDTYNLARAASTTAIVSSVGSAGLVTTLLYISIPWLTPPILHRSYALGLILLTTSVQVAWRVLYAKALVQPAFRQRGLCVGCGGGLASTLVDAVREAGHTDDANPYRGTGYDLVGVVADESDLDADDGVPMLGSIRKLVRLARQHAVDEIILASQDERALSVEARQTLLDCRELGLRISSISSVYERLTGRLPVDYAYYDLQLLLDPVDNPGSRLYLAAKRGMDVVLSLIGLLLLAPLVPVVALVNALWSPGPLFYRQERMGAGGRPFTLIKLRSMVEDAERCTGAVWCGDEDPRITPIGRFLRKTRLDEAPQLINVLRGDMSIVGPRPERPKFVGQLARTFPLYRARHAVKPGITGWAQVHHEYGDSVEDARIKLEYDLYYLKHASLYLDLLILLHTVRVVVGGQGR